MVFGFPQVYAAGLHVLLLSGVRTRANYSEDRDDGSGDNPPLVVYARRCSVEEGSQPAIP